jgi:hypothetical protein
MLARQFLAGFARRRTFPMLLHIRSVMHFLWLKDFPNAEISRAIDSVSGEVAIRLRAIQMWMQGFEDGDHCFEDGPRNDRPR